jgi:hypothetical protein
MLEVSRAETRELAGLAGLPYEDDPSNLDPGLRPRLAEALARTASLLHSDEVHLAVEGASVPVLETGSTLALPIGSLHAVARPVADRAIRACLGRRRPPYAGTGAEMAEIWEVAGRQRQRAVLGGGLEVSHDGPLLVFETPGERPGAEAPVSLEVGRNRVGGFEILVDRVQEVCRVLPIGSWSAVFPDDVALEASVDDGRLVVSANKDPAWLPGVRRLPVAWYQPGTCGYLSVFAREDSGWT